MFVLEDFNSLCIGVGLKQFWSRQDVLVRQKMKSKLTNPWYLQCYSWVDGVCMKLALVEVETEPGKNLWPGAKFLKSAIDWWPMVLATDYNIS